MQAKRRNEKLKEWMRGRSLQVLQLGNTKRADATSNTLAKNRSLLRLVVRLAGNFNLRTYLGRYWVVNILTRSSAIMKAATGQC